MILNRYYLVDLPRNGAPTRLDAVLAKMTRTTGKRERPCDIGHYRFSSDGTQAIVQAALDDAERAWLVMLPWITDLGGYDTSTGQPDLTVREWFTANNLKWEEGLHVQTVPD